MLSVRLHSVLIKGRVISKGPRRQNASLGHSKERVFSSPLVQFLCAVPVTKHFQLAQLFAVLYLRDCLIRIILTPLLMRTSIKWLYKEDNRMWACDTLATFPALNSLRIMGSSLRLAETGKIHRELTGIISLRNELWAPKSSVHYFYSTKDVGLSNGVDE